MLFIFPILFKIIPPNNINGTIHQKGGTPPGNCSSASNRYISDIDQQSPFFQCKSSGYTISIEKVTFSNCRVTYNWFSEYTYTNLNIKECTFSSCTYKTRLISAADHDSSHKFNFVSNTITNCYDHESNDSVSVISYYQYNFISQNSIIYNSNTQNTAKAFYFNHDRGLTFTGNSVKNGFSVDGSGGLHIEGMDNNEFSPLVFSDCVFTNINGDCYKEHFATTVFFYRLSYALTITNVTFEHCKKTYVENGYGKGYMIQIEPNKDTYTSPYVTFKNCKFSYLEFNGQNGGGIGMLIRKPPEDGNAERYSFTIKYEDTTFEHIYFLLDSNVGGGAISISYDVEESKYTNIYVNNCTFKNVSSKGCGGAIYFNSPRRILEVKKSKFADTYTRDDFQVAGAIYVNYYSGSMRSNIIDCEFENTRSSYSGAIKIQWHYQETADITISGCTFRKTYAYIDYNSINLGFCHDNKVYINNNKFIDCCRAEGSSKTFVNYLDVQRLYFNYNQIIFSNETESCGCVKLYTVLEHLFNGNLFQNARYSTSYAAGIHINNFFSYSTLNIQNNTFKQIQGNNGGRCIYINTITNSNPNAVVFRNNTIEDCPEGGNLIRFYFSNTISQYTVESCRFISNRVTQLYIHNVNTLIYTECYFENNMNTANNGGAIRYSNNANLVKILKCQFYDNRAKNSGSAISFQSTPGCEIKQCTFARNTCESGSGSIFANYASVSRDMIISQCVFDNNTAYVNGAAIYFKGNLGCSISNCNFSGSTCTTGSGAIYLEFQSTDKNVNINKCNFNDNIANKDGSSIFIQAKSYCEINNCNFSHNTCQTGSGSISCSVESTCNIIQSNFKNNTVQTDGGAIIFKANDGDIKKCTFTRNTCNTGSGTINCRTLNTKIIKCEFISNTVQLNGSAVLFYSILGCEFTECTFVKNTCKEGSGTIHFTILDLNQTIEINKCEFNESQGQDVHCIDFYDSKDATINIIESNFNDCGINGYMIRVQSSVQQILLHNCSLYFSKNQTTMGLFLNSDRISLIGNTFQHFGNAVVHFPCSSSDEKIEVVENFFIDCSGSPVFDITSYLKTSPTFIGNTFDNIHSNNPVLRLKFEDNVNCIVFDNNTFRNFNTNNDFGGIGLEIDHVSNEILFNVSFANCYFINNINTNNQQNGGALSFGPKQNNGNICFYLFECFFEINQIENKGSSLFLNIQHEIIIESCQFIENPESKGTIYIEQDCGSDPQQSTLLITNCHFKHNKGGELSTIYIAPSTNKEVQIISCTFEEDEGGIYLDSIKQKSEIIRNTMIGIKVSPALNIKQFPEFESSVKECTFDSCTTDNNKCFNIFIIDSPETLSQYQFSDNIIRNNIAHGHESYLGSIICNKKIYSLRINNISFINNTCDCLYGGGIGIEIKDVKSDLYFENCLFLNNSAKQNKEISRPTNNPDIKYYNGDGGAIQFGYICWMNIIDIFFNGCTFKNNRAARHGGAISIQTNQHVEILYCRFENNEANYNFEESSSELLIDNYFHLKNEGRGGAIYINPSYTHDSCKIDDYMLEVTILDCEFVSNNGYDGYGIYVEGEDVGTKFEIKQNIFTNNFNESNHNEDVNDIYGAVITTEIYSIERQQIIEDNTFNYSNHDLKVLEISYVDHYGKTPSKAFSKSDAFTESNILPPKYFTQSKYFSNSHFFSRSQKFSKSNDFSNSDQFTKSKMFSKSNDFSNSDQFTKSKMFSESNDFSSTDHFSNSDKFTKSKMFSESDSFSHSRYFSQSCHFTDNLISSGDNTEISPEETKESLEMTTKSTEEITQLSTKETIEISPDETTESMEVIIKSTEEITQLSTDGNKSEETISYTSTDMSNDHDLIQSTLSNEPNSQNKNVKKKNNTIIIVVVVVIVVVLLILALTFAILYKKKRTEKKEEEITSKETSPTNKITQPETLDNQDNEDYDLNFWL